MWIHQNKENHCPRTKTGFDGVPKVNHCPRTKTGFDGVPKVKNNLVLKI